MSTNPNVNAASGSSSGAGAAQDVKAGGLEAYGQSEKLRHGINQFFDETIQPSAAKDASHGSSAAHKTSTAEPTQNAYTQATAVLDQ